MHALWLNNFILIFYLINKYILRLYYVLDPIVRPWDKKMNKNFKSLSFSHKFSIFMTIYPK